ncbi:MAG: hemolysin family protein [Actinomycetota bacterium]|nr:hemolysin family protein [Actinomycetota bacterium]
MDDPVFGIALTFVLLALNALFVGSEFALISARRTQIEPRAAGGSRAARLTLRAMEQVSLVMAAAQLGITICTLLLGAISEPVIAHLMEPVFELARMPDFLVHPVAFVVATALIVYAHVVFGEMVPKNIALAASERSALFLGPFMLGVVFVLKPFVVGLNAMANATLRLMRVQPQDEVTSSFTHDEVAGMVEDSRREGLLDAHEYDLLSGALYFHAGTIERVLLPLDDLVSIDMSGAAGEVEAACARTGYSRFPVRRADSEDLIGYLHVKDVLSTTPEQLRQPVQATWVRPLATVGAGTSLYDALRAMQVRDSHIARVADDEGRVLGVIMLEDVLEELVGEVAEAKDGEQAQRPARRTHDQLGAQ